MDQRITLLKLKIYEETGNWMSISKQLETVLMINPGGLLPPSPSSCQQPWAGQITDETQNPYAMVSQAMWTGKCHLGSSFSVGLLCYNSRIPISSLRPSGWCLRCGPSNSDPIITLYSSVSNLVL